MTHVQQPDTERSSPEISARGRAMPASPIRRLAPLAEGAKRRGIRVLHLNIGQPDLETPSCMRDQLRLIDDKVLEYSPSNGTPQFLASLQHYYQRRLGVDLDIGEIIATTGGSEAILFALFACANPGEGVVVVEPYYANYKAFATMAGLDLVPVTSRGREGFHIPPQHVWDRQLAMHPRPRVVILCNPNNPTGTVYSREELEMVAGICRERDLFLISDEVYREFVYDGHTATSALSLEDHQQRVIVVDSLSKRYSACGIRLGCLVTRNREVYDAASRMAQGRLSPPGLAQMIAVAAQGLGDDYYQGVVEEYQRRRDILFEGLSSIPGAFLLKPEGAFYCVARLPIDDSDRFAAWLLTDFQSAGRTVMVAPAGGFYASELGRQEVRIAYVLNENDLRQAIEVLRQAVEAYPGRTPIVAGGSSDSW
jgi:aspartate aminotransferase